MVYSPFFNQSKVMQAGVGYQQIQINLKTTLLRISFSALLRKTVPIETAKLSCQSSVSAKQNQADFVVFI